MNVSLDDLLRHKHQRSPMPVAFFWQPLAVERPQGLFCGEGCHKNPGGEEADRKDRVTPDTCGGAQLTSRNPIEYHRKKTPPGYQGRVILGNGTGSKGPFVYSSTKDPLGVTYRSRLNQVCRTRRGESILIHLQSLNFARGFQSATIA